jgi:hypothetical protein
MFHLKARRLAGVTAAVTVAGLGMSSAAIAQDRGAQVFNFGGCMSSGQPDGFPYASEGFGPMTLVLNRDGVRENQPFGISAFGPAARPEGQVACPPSGA